MPLPAGGTGSKVTGLTSIPNTGGPQQNGSPPTAPASTVAKNLVLAGPATGSNAAPTYRALVGADLPAAGLTATIVTAKLTPVTGVNGSMTFTNGILTAHTDAT